MKENFIHVCFVIDSSGSMCGSEADVIGGFKRVVDEQKANENGSCAVTVIDFNSYPEVVCVGKDVHDIDSELNYAVGGGTALFDAIRLGIDKTHEYNMSLDNAERPEKTMVVIMTDGGENCSRYNSGSAIKDKIKEMETEFGWSFVYLGSDLSDVQDANTLGIKTRGVSTKSAMMSNYDVINSTVNVFRCATGTTEMKYATMDNVLENSVETLNANYETSTGIKIN
jgi:uncharacterized protein YegL